MTAKSNDSDITAAFELLLEGLRTRRRNLADGLSPAGEAEKYDTITKLTASLKRTSSLISDLEKLKREWAKEDKPQPAPKRNQVAEKTLYAGPTRFDLCIPTLQALDRLDGQGDKNAIRDQIIDLLSLSLEVTSQTNPKRKETELEYQLHWARTTLKICGLIDNPTRGIWELTNLGQNKSWPSSADEVKKLWQRHLSARKKQKQASQQNQLPLDSQNTP